MFTKYAKDIIVSVKSIAFGINYTTTLDEELNVMKREIATLYKELKNMYQEKRKLEEYLGISMVESSSRYEKKK